MANGNAQRDKWLLLGLRVWAAIGILYLLDRLGLLLGLISGALLPFAVGLVIVLVLRRPVESLSTRMPRTLAVVVCYASAIAVLALVSVFVIPPIWAQIVQFIEAVPAYAQQAYKLWDAYVAHPKTGANVPGWLQTAVVAVKDQLVASAGSWSSAIAQGAMNAGGSIVGAIVAVAIGLMVGFYTLADLPKLQDQVLELAGERWRDEVAHALRTVSRVFGGWLRGVLIESTVVAVLFSIGLAIVQVPYALAIGVIGGVLNIVPYIGPWTAVAIAGGAGLFVSPTTALWAMVVMFAVQNLDTMVMQPRIMSDQVNLHPLLIVFSLLAGGALFGVPGMVLGVPVAAVVKALFVYWYEKRAETEPPSAAMPAEVAAAGAESSDAGSHR